MANKDRRKFLKQALALGLGAVFAPAVAAQDMYDPDAAALQARFAQATAGLPTVYKHETLGSDSTEDVAVRLVCYFDISGSIDNEEHRFQLEAMAAAIESDDFKQAVFARGGPGSLAITIADFDDTAAMRIPWVDFRDREADDHKFAALAEEIRNIPRRANGMTSQARALQNSMLLLDNAPWGADKSIVDILTDGKINTAAEALEPARQLLTTRYEATINALVTETSNETDTRDWAEENLRTLPGHVKRNGSLLEPGFVKVVATQRTNSGGLSEYNRAMQAAFKRKLILEVAGIDIDPDADNALNGAVRSVGRILNL